ncbi:MBL fold metallo-hydrolase [Exiguobacterium aestuarii]|uniref:MBL fold metallo-hydrolase n=1 Tax=Exiguobacterium aestuarii TaxID=273527 RepID=A0ABW2PSX8_9BACL|nr:MULTISPECIES: MBL fold metallo-hydrolase [Exiguobacterium]MCT4785165.1 MBL fold metallo-hydrolase [Exiguobacterium aestuarii]
MQTLIKHSERFWYMTPVAHTDRPILGAVVGDTHTLLIDAGNSVAHTSLFLDELQKQGLRAPSMVALTHWHWDHIFGLPALEGVVSIASEATKHEMKKLIPYAWDDASLNERVAEGIEIEFCAEAIREEYGDSRDIQIVLPTLTFQESLTLDLGGVHVVLKYVGGDHSKDSIVLYLVEERVLFLGDALYANLYAPTWRMTPEATLRLLDILETFDAQFIVWSHGEMVSHEAFAEDCLALRRIATISKDFPGNNERINHVYAELINREINEEEQELITFFVNGTV